MKIKKYVLVALLASLLLVTFSSAAQACRIFSAASPLDGDWNIVMIDDMRLGTDASSDLLPFIRFESSQNQISGHSGCNSFSGDASYLQNSIEVGNIVSTLIACPDMEIEEQLFEILNSPLLTFDFEGETLILSNEMGNQIRLKRQ